MIDPPHRDPAATLLSYRSLLVPTLAHRFSLCAFTGTPYWQCRYGSIGDHSLIVLNPQPQSLSAYEFSAAKGHGRDWGATLHSPGHRFADVRLRAMKQFCRISQGEQIESLQ